MGFDAGGKSLACMWGVSNLGLGGCSGLGVLTWALLHLSSLPFAFWTPPSFFLLFPCFGNGCSDLLMPFAWRFIVKRVGGGLGIKIGQLSSSLFGLAGAC